MTILLLLLRSPRAAFAWIAGAGMLASALAACSSSSSPAAAPPAAGSDASTEDSGGTSTGDDGGGARGGGDAGQTASITCGAAPYVNLGIVVRQIGSGSAPGDPIAGATLTSTFCAGVSAISGADGAITAQVTKGAAFTPRFQATNYATSLVAELAYDADATGLDATLPPSLFTAFIPGFNATTSAIIVGAMTDRADAGPCAALDGVTFTVTDHPEAKVVYFTDDAIPQVTTGTTTTVAGRAAITGIAGVGPVAVVGIKTGCTIDFARAPYTGRVALEAGALTLVPAFLH